MLIRRKSFLALGATGASAALLAACSGGSDSSGSSGSDAGGASDGGGAAPKRANADLVIWADEKKAESLKAAAEAWGKKNSITVAVQAVASEIHAAFKTANQAGNGPDILMEPHDGIGDLVQNSAISPVQLPADASSKISKIALDAVQFQNQSYGVPYAVETVVLYANKALTDSPEPASIEDLVNAGKAKGAENPLSLQVGTEGDAYHMEPLYTSAGGYLFGKNADGTLNPKDLGVGKEGSIAAGEKMKELGAQGVLKTSIGADNAISLFTGGKAAYLMTGPWAISDIKKAKIDYNVAACPGFAGMNPAKPFAGVQCFFIASQAKNAAYAQQFLNDVASSPEIAEAMFAKNELPPVNLELQQKLAADHPEMVKIAQLAEGADPMPSIPEMSTIWAPLGKAEANIVNGADPKSTMESAGTDIAAKIK